MASRPNDGEKTKCTCNETTRYLEYPGGGRRNIGVPPCMSPDCPVGFGNRVLAEQEAAEYEAYLDGTVVYGHEY